MGDTWRGVETITKTGEIDQGVTVLSASHWFYHFNLRPSLFTSLVVMIDWYFSLNYTILRSADLHNQPDTSNKQF